MESKPLWEATRDLHHACEQHIVGSAMASGDPPKIWYAAWLMALHQIHSLIDEYVDSLVARENLILDDISTMEIEIEPLNEAIKFVESLTTQDDIDGTIYVLMGAHLMGGEILKKRLVNFPTKHLEWEDRKYAIGILQQYRTRVELAQPARNCFNALLSVMNEIQERYPITKEN